MEPIVNAAKNDQIRDTTVVTAINKRSDQVGVCRLGCINENTFGNCPSVLSANGNREPPNTIAFKVPVIEMTAPLAMSHPPHSPIKRWAASANGFSDVASPGSVPI